MEGHWENHPGEGVPLMLFGMARTWRRETTRYAVAIPDLGSLILTHSLGRPDPGAEGFPPEDRPNATIVFWTFRVMVGLGMLMIAARRLRAAGCAGAATALRSRRSCASRC